jgi:hypothetical protein
LALSLWHIIFLASFCTIAALLIVGLLMQRSRHGRAKEALHDSEERYFLALAGSTDGLWDWDLLSETVFYSDRFREILGYSFEEFPGTIDSFRRRLHPEDVETIWTAIERLHAAKNPYRPPPMTPNTIKMVTKIPFVPSHLSRYNPTKKQKIMQPAIVRPICMTICRPSAHALFFL